VRLPAAHKVVEILEESRAVAADKRHRPISAVASPDESDESDASDEPDAT
jgi:hypothetical protein